MSSTVFRGLVEEVHPDDFFALSGGRAPYATPPTRALTADLPELPLREWRSGRFFTELIFFCRANRQCIALLAGHILCDRYGNKQLNITKILREIPKIRRSRAGIASTIKWRISVLGFSDKFQGSQAFISKAARELMPASPVSALMDHLAFSTRQLISQENLVLIP